MLKRIWRFLFGLTAEDMERIERWYSPKPRMSDVPPADPSVTQGASSEEIIAMKLKQLRWIEQHGTLPPGQFPGEIEQRYPVVAEGIAPPQVQAPSDTQSRIIEDQGITIQKQRQLIRRMTVDLYRYLHVAQEGLMIVSEDPDMKRELSGKVNTEIDHLTDLIAEAEEVAK
jgi:hypothetical protein